MCLTRASACPPSPVRFKQADAAAGDGHGGEGGVGSSRGGAAAAACVAIAAELEANPSDLQAELRFRKAVDEYVGAVRRHALASGGIGAAEIFGSEAAEAAHCTVEDYGCGIAASKRAGHATADCVRQSSSASCCARSMTASSSASNKTGPSPTACAADASNPWSLVRSILALGSAVRLALAHRVRARALRNMQLTIR